MTRKSISQDTKQNITRMLLKGVSKAKVAETFNVDPRTVQRVYLKTTTRKPRKKATFTLTYEQKQFVLGLLRKGYSIKSVLQNSAFEKFLDKFPNANLSLSTFYKLVKKELKHSYTTIKRVVDRKNNVHFIIDRYIWLKQQIISRKIDYYNCVFVDECAFVLSDHIKKAWTRVGVTGIVNSGTKLSNNESMTCMGAISSQGLLLMAVKLNRSIGTRLAHNPGDADETEHFASFLEDLISKNRELEGMSKFYAQKGNISLSTGTQRNHFFEFLWKLMIRMYATRNIASHKYIYLDNAAIHHGEAVKNLVLLFNAAYKTDYEILYGFRYSPDLNPIELYWKALRDNFVLLRHHSNIVDRLVDASNRIDVHMVQKFIIHTGKMLSFSKQLKPLLEGPVQEIEVPQIEDENFENEYLFVHAKSLIALLGGRSLEELVSGKKMAVIHKGAYGKGKRLYFVLEGELYKCSFTVAKMQCPAMLKMALLLPENYKKYGIGYLDINSSIEVADFLMMGITVKHISPTTKRVYFESGGQVYNARFEECAISIPEKLVQFRLSLLEKERSIQVAEIRSVSNSRRKRNYSSISEVPTSTNKKQQTVSDARETDITPDFSVKIIEILKTGVRSRAIRFISENGTEDRLSYTKFKQKYRRTLLNYENSQL